MSPGASSQVDPPFRFVIQRALASAFVLALFAAGCEMRLPGGEAGGNGSGPGKRQQRLALSPDEELRVGQEAYRKELTKLRAQILPADNPDVIRTRQICSRIIRAVGIRPLQKEINLKVNGYSFEWEVNVVRDKQINAYCLPGGKIVVFTGIIQFAENDDQLAAVIAHEISHALAHHASERVALEQSRGGSGLGGLKNDRSQESEADHIGTFLMTFAGYDPNAAVHLWEKMEKSNRGGFRPEILSDHPSDARRARDIQGWVPKALAAKKAFDEGRVVKD